MGEMKETMTTSDPEKIARSSDSDVSGQPPMVQRGSIGQIMLSEGLTDGRYEKTQRGLKSRHAQMIALGGTIGTG